jgi:(5-formylfuran-3-yl)methyl phosphate synthase
MPINPKLLISVRSAAEAHAALAGGADWIDIKEPNRGSLGVADRGTIADVLREVAGQRPVSAAAGEWYENHDLDWREFPELARIKLGLAGGADDSQVWRHVKNFAQQLPRREALVLTAYADYSAARAPCPADLLARSAEMGLEMLLVDTFDKSAGTLFDALGADQLGELIEQARQVGIEVVLAGSLSGDSITVAYELGPAMIGVRGAACRGGRSGEIDAELVAALLADDDQSNQVIR